MNKFIKNTSVIVMTVLISLPFVSCKNKKNIVDNTVGVLLKSDQDSFWQTYKGYVLDAAKETGLSVKVYAFDNDAPTQIDQIKTMLMNGIKYFFIVPASTDLTNQISHIIASQGGVAVFSNVVPTIDALKLSKNFYYTSSPETEAGAYQAELLDEYFKKNPGKLNGKTVNILYFNGEFGHPAQIPRQKGFLEAMESKGYKVNILSQIAANWHKKVAREAMNIWIQKNGISGVDAIITQNDDMAIGAINAFIDNNVLDDPSNPTRDTDGDGISVPVPIIGVDGTERGKKLLNDNQLYGSVFQDMKSQVRTGFEIIKECKENGTAIGFTTPAGVKAATKTSTEAPLTDSSVLGQCFIVPYVPLKK